LRSGIKRKHITLTIINKLKVIEQPENGVPGGKIAEEFDTGHRLCQILKNKENLLRRLLQNST
jgi:hypothetical protein